MKVFEHLLQSIFMFVYIFTLCYDENLKISLTIQIMEQNDVALIGIKKS